MAIVSNLHQMNDWEPKLNELKDNRELLTLF